MKMSKSFVLGIVLTIIILSCGTAAAVEVDTIADLQSNASAAAGDMTIQLGEEFPRELDSSITLTLNNNANITIIGGSREELMTIKSADLTTPHFTLSDSSGTAANIEFKNIEFVGRIPDSALNSDGGFGSVDHGALPAGGGIVGGPKGKMTFENCVFKQIRGNVFSGAPNLVLKNSTFISNSNTFNVITNTTKPLTIENSTFAYNYANGWGGYSGGLIGLYTDSQCNISNTIFINNFFAGGGTGQGGGGAISFVRGTATSFLNITDSVFENNTVGSAFADAKSTTADGGALYLFQMVGEIYISGSTFENNTAYDEAGAISFQGTTNSRNRVENCTFYGNKAQGLEPGDQTMGGGAIELYNTNGAANVTFEGNTFVKNVAEGNNAGGAMYLYLLSRATLTNNIISGNIDRNGESSTSNILNSLGTITNKGGNFINNTTMDVFGIDDPTPVEIGSKMAGDPKSDFYKIIKTIPLNPEGNAFNNGLKPSHANATLLVDQNDKLRNGDTPNSGAIELQYVKYDLETDGEWRAGEFIEKVNEADTANGTVINRAAEFKSNDYYYQLVFEDGTYTPVTTRIPVHKTDPTLVFKGWVDETDTETTETDGSRNVVLTPVWGAIEYIVIFQDWDETELKRESVAHGTGATAPADPVRDGHTFIGWDKDFSAVTEDMTVTALYEEDEGTPGGGNGTGSAVVADGGSNINMTNPEPGYEEPTEVIPGAPATVAVLLFMIAVACYVFVVKAEEED